MASYWLRIFGNGSHGTLPAIFGTANIQFEHLPTMVVQVFVFLSEMRFGLCAQLGFLPRVVNQVTRLA